MNYTPNTIDWQIGDLVIHDADDKAEHMLMRVIGIDRHGQIKTKYLFPDTERHFHAKVWTNQKEHLHDPARFGIFWSERPAAPASASEASPPTPVPAPGPVAAVYAKYKHLDSVFAMLAKRDAKTEGNPIHEAAADLWNAIKAQEAPHA
jgi:hypothetical protein